MVMQAMRAGTKPLMLLVIAAFVATIVFAWGMDFTSRPAQRGVIGEVAGEELSLDEYAYRYQNALQQRQQSGQGDITEEEAQQIRDQVFDQMVNSVLINQLIDDKDLRVTNSELAQHLRRFPPPEVQQIPDFQTNGQFDYSKYLQAYQTPNPQLWLQIEALTRPRVLQQKVIEYVTSIARVNDAEVKELYEAANEQVRVRYLYAPASNYRDSVENADSVAALTYYEEHKDEFRHKERARLRYLTLTKAPSTDDSIEVRRDMEALAERARGGEDFAELARNYSDDQTAQQGGNLGWFGRGAMVPQFEQAAFALDSGQISDPVLTQYGYHVIKSLGKRGSGDSLQVNASHILMRIDVSSTTTSDLRIRGEQLVEDARRFGLDSAAKLAGMPIGTSGWFERGQSMRGIGADPLINEYAFTADPGSISDPFDTPRSFVIVEVTEREPAGIAPFSEVMNRIRGELNTKARTQAAYDALMAIFPQIKSGTMTLADAAQAGGYTYDSTGYFGRYDQVRPFGDDPNFRGMAFALNEQNPMSIPFKTEFGAAIIGLIDRRGADMQLYADKRDSIFNATMGAKQQLVYNNWFTNMRQNAEVNDFRYQMPGAF
ncbi:MAG: peptidylprolyl isomerase [Candidatus Zixiibacteriota bacterium]